MNATRTNKKGHSKREKVETLLRTITKENGRYLTRKPYTKNGLPVYGSGSQYDGTDYQEGTAEELLEWERGYRK